MIGGEKVVTDRLGSVVHRYGRGLEIVNGGMEAGVAPWYAYYGAEASISTVARTGAQSLRVTTPIVDRGVYQEVKDLVPGRTYEFRAWVRAESGTTLAALAVCDPNYSAFVWTGVYTVGTTWQMLSVTFTANSMGVARVHLAKHDTTGAQLWDDVELVNGATAVKIVRPAYYPYGQERGTVTENDTAKFGTYTRDAATGLDYAMNRYYQSTWGRG